MPRIIRKILLFYLLFVLFIHLKYYNLPRFRTLVISLTFAMININDKNHPLGLFGIIQMKTYFWTSSTLYIGVPVDSLLPRYVSFVGYVLNKLLVSFVKVTLSFVLPYTILSFRQSTTPIFNVTGKFSNILKPKLVLTLPLDHPLKLSSLPY